MKNSNVILMGSVVLILLAVGIVAILDKAATPTGGQNTDVRARAATQFTLKLVGVVSVVNEEKGTVEVSNLQFAEGSRAGDAKDLGNWLVTAPAGFNFASISQGSLVTIGVDAKTFQVTKHEVWALTMAPAVKK